MADRVFEPSFIWKVILKVIPYIGVTLKVVLFSFVFASIIGALLARAKIRGKVGKRFADFYTAIFRCVPSIVLIFLVYYGIPKFLKDVFGIDINDWAKEIFIIVTFSLMFAANLCEIFRAAYYSVEPVQIEAGLSVGLTYSQTFFRIVFPQALRYALPNLATVLTTLMKEGSLAYTIGLIDVMGEAKQIISLNYGSYSLETYLALAIIYWILTKVIETAFGLWDKQLSKGRRSLA